MKCTDSTKDSPISSSPVSLLVSMPAFMVIASQLIANRFLVGCGFYFVDLFRPIMPESKK